jgi:hypothetical protein
MRSRNSEAQWRHHEEEEILEFVRSMGISEDELKKTKDSVYHPPLIKTPQEMEE